MFSILLSFLWPFSGDIPDCAVHKALIYDEGLDRHQPSSNIESWMRAAVADANRICCPASASYKTFQISNDSQLPAILGKMSLDISSCLYLLVLPVLSGSLIHIRFIGCFFELIMQIVNTFVCTARLLTIFYSIFYSRRFRYPLASNITTPFLSY